MIRRLRLFLAEARVHYLQKALLDHGTKHEGCADGCPRWDQISARLDHAYDQLTEAAA